MRLQEKAFDIGRAIGKHRAASRLFCLVEPVLPLDRLGRSAHCVAFTHPRPSYDPHILIVPTTSFPELVSPGMGADAKAALLWEMVELAREAVGPGPENDWQMIVNGGTRQEIGQVHGHLINAREIALSDRPFLLVDPSSNMVPWALLFERLSTAATRPDNGYSVIFQLTAQGPATAWITESIPA